MYIAIGDHLIKVSNLKEGVCHEEGDHCQVACIVPHRAVDPSGDQLSNLMKKLEGVDNI